MSFLPASCRCGAGGYLAPADAGGADAPSSVFDVVPEADAAPVASPPRDYAVAVHEASHAVIGHILGFQIERATVDGQACVIWAGATDDIGNAPLARIAVAIAGDMGARLILQRLEFRPMDDAVLATFQTVRALRIGGCDACVAALSCFAECGAEADDAPLLATYRRAETLTVAMLREPRVASAVRVLAGLLMLNGKMLGPAIHDALAAVGLPIGSAADHFTPEEEKHDA